MRDYKNDPKYWTQFDEDSNLLPIDSIEIEVDNNQKQRIIDLLKEVTFGETERGVIKFDWYDAYQFLQDK